MCLSCGCARGSDPHEGGHITIDVLEKAADLVVAVPSSAVRELARPLVQPGAVALAAARSAAAVVRCAPAAPAPSVARAALAFE